MLGDKLDSDETIAGLNKRGRPLRSVIRQNIVNILFVIRDGYGYEIYKIYKMLFPSVTMRAVYYNLNKGVELEELSIIKTEKASGRYSWGKFSERTYYCLGRNASPNADDALIRKINGAVESINKMSASKKVLFEKGD